MRANESEMRAEAVPGHCTLPQVPVREFAPGTDPGRAAAILINQTKWVNGTVLRYYFFTSPARWRGAADDVAVVRAAFDEWKGLGIGLNFQEVGNPAEAEIRIGFDQDDGSWSYVGRDVLGRPTNERTMNFGWRLAGWSYGHDTALHEIAHSLGLPHEHQNPNAGIVWNEPKVMEYFSGPPNNWDPDTIHWNILRKINPSDVQGSNWDRHSVMHYRFEAGLIDEPVEFRTTPLVPAGGLSPRDEEWIREFYPPQDEEKFKELKPFESAALKLQPGQQADFLVLPTETRRYEFSTFGSADTVLVLFEDVQTDPEGSGWRFVAGDDDSGTDRNARFGVKLFKGRRYMLRTRLYWAWASGQTAVMMW
jgi:hypothetical protein